MGVIMILAKRGIYFLLVFICRCYGDLKEKSVFGVVTSESVIVAASSALSGGDMKLRGNHDGIVVLGQPSCYSSFNNEGGDVLVGLRGEHSDCDIIIADLEAVCDQHLESYDTSLSRDSIVQYYRKIIYEALSKLHQYNTDALVGGNTSYLKRRILCLYPATLLIALDMTRFFYRV